MHPTERLARAVMWAALGYAAACAHIIYTDWRTSR